jgi:uncharacterized protein YcfJ
MDTIKTTSRIHPLMAAAAASVIIVSLAGTAAITGLLPSSHSAPEAVPMNPAYGAALAPTAAQQGALQAAPVQAAYAQAYPQAQAQQLAYPQQAQGFAPQPLAAVQPAAPAPVVIKETVIKEVPAKPVVHTKVVHHTQTRYVRDDGYVAPAPRQAAQPNYVAIGTGAVLGGLVGNQVGSGNGRKLATVAGIIGGGYLGNQIANQNR